MGQRVMRRGHVAAGLALLLASGMASAQYRPRHSRNTGSTDRRFLNYVAEAQFSLFASYLYPSTTSQIPTVESGAVLCRVGAVTGSATEWECVNSAGTSAATAVVTGSGCTAIDSFIPDVKALEITAACAPSATSATLDALFDNPYTVVVVGFTRGGVVPFWFSAEAGSGGSMSIATEGGLRLRDTAAIRVTATSSLTNGWGVGSGRWVGGTDFGAHSNDTYATATEATAHAAFAGAGTYFFGTRSARDLHLNGPLAMVYIVPRSMSATELAELNNQIFGVRHTTGLLVLGNNPTQAADNTATTGNVDVFFNGARLANASGLTTSKVHTNAWAADALAAATWTDVGTPTITSNVSSGPFAVYGKAAECDLIEDDDGAAFEGKQGATAGTTLGNYHASCYLKAGTSGTTTTTARISFAAPGGTATPAQCDLTGLTSTAQRKTCATVITGSPTSIKASVLVGNAAAETGSIVACQCQLTATSGMEPPDIDNTARSSLFYSSVAPAAWPAPSAGGKYELVHTPKADPSTQWIDAALDTYYIFDTSTAADADHVISFVYGYVAAGRFLAAIRGPAGEIEDITINGIAMTPGQAYAVSTEWRPVGGGFCNYVVRHNTCGATAAGSCYATTIIGSSLDGTKKCPGTPANFYLGNRYSGTYPSSATIHALRVYGL